MGRPAPGTPLGTLDLDKALADMGKVFGEVNALLHDPEIELWRGEHEMPSGFRETSSKKVESGRSRTSSSLMPSRTQRSYQEKKPSA